MFVERKLNPATSKVELWYCEWRNRGGKSPRKVRLKKIGDEQELATVPAGDPAEVSAICWAYGRTLGNIAVRSPSLVGLFPEKTGDDAQLPCDFVYAAKYRHGADRWWCRTHQTHWGTKADIESFAKNDVMRCANNTQAMCYVVAPLTVDLDKYDEVGIWCSMPAAISTETVKPRAPRIHVHVRPEVGGKKIVDKDFSALSVVYGSTMGLFSSKEITRVNITPPAAFEFVCGLERKLEMTCINCSTCGYPHLDLGDFGRTPHRKHFCGNCGRDSTWSKRPIISTPLQSMHDRFAKTVKYEIPKRELNLDERKGCSYTIWASTPAVIWTASRPQEFGIHVHVHEGARRVVDDTFGTVILNGRSLERASLIQSMIDRTII